MTIDVKDMKTVFAIQNYRTGEVKANARFESEAVCNMENK